MRPGMRLLTGATVALSACGGGSSNMAPVAETDPTETSSSNMAPPTVAPPEASTTVIDRIDEPATATTPAERLDDELVVTWIGGSDLELDGRSLPAAVAARSPTNDGRAIRIIADVSIGPLPADIRERVERAVDRNVDGLIVPLSPSWLTWNGHDDCRGLTPPHAFYSCILDPAPGTDVDALRAETAALVDTIVASGIPAYLYVIPHSAEALADPLLSGRLASSEATFAALDPGIARITYIGHVVTRDLDDLHEGVDFFDMVHPTEAGIERLADFFAAALPRAIGLTPN